MDNPAATPELHNHGTMMHRVAIMKDVIKQLDAGRYNGTLTHFIDPGDAPAVGYPVGALTATSCRVCAKGAVVLSYFRMNPRDPEALYNGIDWAMQQLEHVFTLEEMDTMESLFGGSNGSFFLAHPGRDNRLRAIAQNVIDHDGAFTLTV